MNRKIHFSIASHNIVESIEDYSKRLGCMPTVVVENEYALWRTENMNFSIRYDLAAKSGELRHLGWEDNSANEFSTETDVNGIVWECFSEQQQQNDEIKTLWPNAIER